MTYQLIRAWNAEPEHLLRSNHEYGDLAEYRAIVQAGTKIVPDLLRELAKRPEHGIIAMLHDITGANPVLDHNIGNTRDIADDWLEWGRTTFTTTEPFGYPEVQRWNYQVYTKGKERAGWTHMESRAPFTTSSINARYDMTPRGGYWATVFQPHPGALWHANIVGPDGFIQRSTHNKLHPLKRIIDDRVTELAAAKTDSQAKLSPQRGYTQ